MTKRTCMILGIVVASIVATGCRPKAEEQMSEEEVIKLVKLYQEGAGRDDFAGARLKEGGDQIRGVLIKLLDEPGTPSELVGTIGQILHVYFPSDETYDALERFAQRIEDPEEREKNLKMMRALRSMPRER